LVFILTFHFRHYIFYVTDSASLKKLTANALIKSVQICLKKVRVGTDQS